MQKVIIVLILMTLVLGTTGSTGFAAQLVTEARFKSMVGEPVAQELRFSGLGLKDFFLKVQNGEEGGINRISSAVVSLNGIKVLHPADFNQKIQSLQRSIVPLDNENILNVTLRSNPGGVLTVQIYGEPTLNLPPDPGIAGDETIEGIDSNENGIRDDIERWIALNYPDSEKTRQALIQNYYPMQNFMIHARQGDRDAVYNDMDALGLAIDCLYYVRPDDVIELSDLLESVIVNTPDRFYADNDASRMLGGGSFSSNPMSEWKQSCTFDPDALEN